jgi:peptidoglycan/xylan/chitin deacetylase (PgdA/CDA1 family)
VNATKHLALSVYYRLRAPLRNKNLALRQSSGTLPICVLFYHRVADWCPNDWTTPAETFRREIDWLREHFDIVTLAEAQRRIAAGKNDRPTACITFDDGYADNFDFALPYLLREKIPFTYFVCSQHVLRQEPFPHDVATGNPLRPNRADEIALLAKLGIEIGAHSRSHVELSMTLGAEEMKEEIVGSKLDLEDITGKPVRYFAVPYGTPDKMSQEAFRVACLAGYQGVCSAYGAYNLPGQDPFHIRRIHADPEFVRFKNWMTFDPRKLRQRDTFDPGDYRLPEPSEEEIDE